MALLSRNVTSIRKVQIINCIVVIMMSTPVLCFTVLCCTVLYCTALHCTVLYNSMFPTSPQTLFLIITFFLGLYVLGFHPHGIVPVTLFWFRCCAEWETLFPNVVFSPLTASVMHLVPLMRDLLQVRLNTAYTVELLSDRKSVLDTDCLTARLCVE